MVYYYSKYRQCYNEYSSIEWWMLHSYRGYRRVATLQERRRWYQDKEEDAKWRKGQRNPGLLDPWGLLENYPTCYTTKSWKKLYKVKHQWRKPKRKYLC